MTSTRSPTASSPPDRVLGRHRHAHGPQPAGPGRAGQGTGAAPARPPRCAGWPRWAPASRVGGASRPASQRRRRGQLNGPDVGGGPTAAPGAMSWAATATGTVWPRSRRALTTSTKVNRPATIMSRWPLASRVRHCRRAGWSGPAAEPAAAGSPSVDRWWSLSATSASRCATPVTIAIRPRQRQGTSRRRHLPVCGHARLSSAP